VTGAAGAVGREAVAELSEGHEVRPLDRVRMPGRSATGDLSRGVREGRWWLPIWWRRPSWHRVFVGADAVLHLAADASPTAPWRSVLRQNIEGAWNVFQAAISHGVPRVVFASSCRWVLGLDPGAKPDWSSVRLTTSSGVRPRTPYGLSKAFGEQAGRMLVDRGDLGTFIAVRIGAFVAGEPRNEEQRRLWVRPADLRSLLRRCLEADVTGYHVVYGLSPEATVIRGSDAGMDGSDWPLRNV